MSGCYTKAPISAAAAHPAGPRRGLTAQQLYADGSCYIPGPISAAAAFPTGPRRGLTAQQLANATSVSLLRVKHDRKIL